MIDRRRDAHLLERVLERRDVARADVHHRVGRPGDGRGVDDLGHTREDALQLVGGDGAPAEQFDVRLGGHPIDGGVDLDRERADDAVGDQPVDPALHRGGRQPHPVADIAVAGAGVLAEQIEDAEIEIVHPRSLWWFVASGPAGWIAPASADAEIIEVIGQQFAWSVRYPGVKDKVLGTVNYKLIDNSGNEFGLDLTDKNSFDDFKSLELHLPVDKEILLKIRAKDVLHSVFLPHFRLKMDAVPGMPTQFKFKATKTTAQMREELGNPNFNYEMACAEICGKGHFSMRMPVVVEDQETYERWKASQEAWLKQNPDYLKKVPGALKEAAMIKAGMQKDPGSSVAEVKE